MENFIVSARKYRPATFESVVGQQHITNTLKNAIKNNQLAQAFLFCGPRGVGKTTCARILAKTINCQHLSAALEPCGECESCRSFQQGNSFSIHELDAASNNSVDDIRSLIEQVRIPPQTGKYKIYIIDEVHMLSQAAFNAFLKTLEEPPSYAIFILATTEKHKILPTILSRCQIFDFNRIKVEAMAQHLAGIARKEQIAFDNDGLHLIAQKADGGLRDALSMFDQIVSFSNRNVTYAAVIENLNILDYDYYFKITDRLIAQDTAGVLVLFDDILANGFDGNTFVNGLASHFRNLLVGKDQGTLHLMEVSDNIRQKYVAQSAAVTVSFLLSALSITNQCDLNYKMSKNQRLQVELALIKLCHLNSVLSLSAEGRAASEGAEKKKPERDAVAAPAAPPDRAPVNPPAPQVVPPNPQVSAAPAPLASPSPEVVKSPSLKSGMLASASLIPNLNDLESPAKKAEADGPVYLSGDSQNPFTADEFLECWMRYAEKCKQVNKLNLFTLMTAAAPELKPNNEVVVGVENKTLESTLSFEKIDLLNFLRSELQNFSITLTSRQVEKTERKRLYTSTEKYQYMAEKNPKLEEFRRRFNLGIE